MKYSFDDLSIGLTKDNKVLNVPHIVSRPDSLPIQDWEALAHRICEVMNNIEADRQEALRQLVSMRGF